MSPPRAPRHQDARWDGLLAAASQPDIAKRIDEALNAIENPRLAPKP